MQTQITFRCGSCARQMEATVAQAGFVVRCPGCQHHNVCPPVAAPTPRPAPRPRLAPVEPPESSDHWIRNTIGLVVLAGVAWVWWSGAGDRSAGPMASASMTPADARQHELLKKNLDRPGDPLLATMYKEINARHFANMLPLIPVAWEPELATVGRLAGREFTLEGMFGFVGARALILLTPELQGDLRALERVLCHEMVHAYLHGRGDSTTSHGPAFQTVLRRLSTEGAFEGLVASEEERTRLKAWLDEEATRLDAEGKTLEELDGRIQRERGEVEKAMADLTGGSSQEMFALVTSLRDAFNLHATEANARLEQQLRDREVFNREVARYNLMLVYPDGMDGEAPTPQAAASDASPGRVSVLRTPREATGSRG